MEALAALLHLIFATADYEYNYEGLRQSTIVVPYASRTLLAKTTLFTCKFILSLVYFFIIRRCYRYKWSLLIHEELNSRKDIMKWQVGHATMIPMTTIFEFFVVIMQPLPFDYGIVMTAGYPILEYTFTLSEILYILMFTKLYIIIRSVMRSSVYTNSDASILW